MIQVGTGGFGGVWCRDFLPPNIKDGLIEVVAAVDVNPDALRIARKFLHLRDEQCYTDLREAFDANRADFCTVVVPPSVHEQVVDQALAHEMHILSEKPIADSLAASVRIAEKVKLADRKMGVTMSHRFDRDKTTLREELRSGRHGPLDYLICRFTCDCRQFGDWAEWRHEMVDPLMVEGAIHHLDILADLAGDGASMLYVCPELQNPMGVDLTPQRRRAVVEWVAARDALLISDEIFHDLHFDGGGPKSLLSDAGPGRTVAIGSLSKSFMCGLRIGWLVSHRDRILSLLDLKNAMDLGCPPLMQGIADALLRSGEYDAHLRNVRRLYKERCDAALEALNEHMPDGVVWTHPAGGFQMWCELPTGYSSLALFLLAVERGVAFLPGPLHDVDHRFVNGFRLAYGSLAPDEIAKGVSLLADAVKELLRHPASDPGLSGVGSFV